MKTVGTRIVEKEIELKGIRKLYNNSKLKEMYLDYVNNLRQKIEQFLNN